jgi:D-beta-D-heptose 7-phosphate kinase/D-beta-D-heptose 1-phosphate adenosyltransferase
MKGSLEARIRAFANRKVLVIGDVMLDEFVRGEVLRISPEAPVPVLEVMSRTFRLGGAANAAANVKTLGGHVTLAGVIGTDREANILRALVEESHVDGAALVADATRPTTHKTRIVARGQQVVRIDNESRSPLAKDVHTELVAGVVAQLAHTDACIISDYGKSVVTPELCREVMAAARAKGCPVIVDPKRKDFDIYRGATVVTPNLHELEVAVGSRLRTTEEIVEAGTGLLPVLDGGALLVTRGAAGMTLLVPGREPAHVSSAARAVFDVTGAGDTVVSTLGLALAAGIDVGMAIELASLAAGIAVSKEGTAAVSVAELLDAVHALHA